MNTIRTIYHIALADFFERARRYSFLLTLAAAIFMGLLVNNGTLFLSLGSTNPNLLSSSYRGEFNSAWIGTMTVLVLNNFLGLFGFYLVSDCIKRDIRTGVGQIIASTPISRVEYLIGKWVSNCMVLYVLVLVMAGRPGGASVAISHRRAALHDANRRAGGAVRQCTLFTRDGGQLYLFCSVDSRGSAFD